MDSRKRSSSSTIEINGALGKRASRSHAQPPLYGRVKRRRASMRIRILCKEGRSSKRRAAKLWLIPDRGEGVCFRNRVWSNSPRRHLRSEQGRISDYF
jgi:hypothetical protein